MSIALSGTADPVDLIPGDPDTIRRDADDLLSEAGHLEDVGACAARRTIPSWQGTAADGCAGRRDTEVERLGAVGQVYRWVAETLYCYADVLAWAQRQAAAAVTLYATATATPAGLTSGGITDVFGRPVPKALDPFGRPIRGPNRPGALDPAKVTAQATADLAAARAVVAQAEQAAADAIDRLVEGMPDGQWHWGSFASGVWDAIVGMVKFAVWDTNLLRGVIDPDGAQRDAVVMWDQATGTFRLLTADPLGAPSILLDTQGFHDDPGRWVGGYAPDIALSMIGGAGMVARGVSAARAGSRTSRAVQAASIEVTVPTAKWNYLFGRASADPHNTPRSAQNQAAFARIGLYDNAAGRAVIEEHLRVAALDSSNILRRFTSEHGEFEVRESLLAGPGGFVKLQTTWRIADGSMILVTSIPMGH
jgi:filamentous hemagglutinin